MGSYMSDVTRMAEELGYTVLMTKSHHFKFVHPDVPGCVFASSSPTNQFRTMRNIKADLLRHLRSGRVKGGTAR